MLILEYVGNFMWIIRNIKDQNLTTPKVFYTIEEAVDWFNSWKSSFPADVICEVRLGAAKQVYY